LRHLPPVLDAQALVGAALADDAAVYRLSDDLALVATVDYITPVVDDPYTWGEIAAANALSDVYAMGARPLFVLNVVNFPRDTLPLTVLEQVIQGGAAKVAEAGVAILGGHSVDDPEPKFGLVALGTVHPDRILRNVGARPGDALLLTKPLGMGILTTAIKRDLAKPETIARAVRSMATLNRGAGEVAVAHGAAVHAVTDVTGFGLLGHLSEMLGNGDVGAEVVAADVPVLAEAWDFAAAGVVPGGSRRNLAGVAPLVRWGAGFDETRQLVLADAQTSGGLLLAVAPESAAAIQAALASAGTLAAARIGTFTDRAGTIDVF
jgi:selenide,water dikinase